MKHILKVDEDDQEWEDRILRFCSLQSGVIFASSLFSHFDFATSLPYLDPMGCTRMVRNVRIHLEGIEADIATRRDMPFQAGTKRIEEVFAVW